jgi:two-component system CheB/CheR fusion protein
MELQAIFEEFHQLDNPARQRSKGLGLGLAIVQRLADLLGHKIDVRSRLAAGSVFAIEVPLGRVEATAPPVLGHAEIPEDVPACGTILIVDDDPVVLDMLRLLFDDQGQRTIVAADGHQALEFTEGSNMPDLIVADYNLPNGITGLEIIARLQARAQHPIPAIILTGDISTESLRDIAGHGCVHLNKPVRAKDLTRLVQRFLAKGAAAGQTPSSSRPSAWERVSRPLFLSLTTTRLSGKR